LITQDYPSFEGLKEDVDELRGSVEQRNDNWQIQIAEAIAFVVPQNQYNGDEESENLSSQSNDIQPSWNALYGEIESPESFSLWIQFHAVRDQSNDLAEMNERMEILKCRHPTAAPAHL